MSKAVDKHWQTLKNFKGRAWKCALFIVRGLTNPVVLNVDLTPSLRIERRGRGHAWWKPAAGRKTSVAVRMYAWSNSLVGGVGSAVVAITLTDFYRSRSRRKFDVSIQQPSIRSISDPMSLRKAAPACGVNGEIR